MSENVGTTLRERHPEEFEARQADILAAGRYLDEAFRGLPLDLASLENVNDTLRLPDARVASIADLHDHTFRYSFREGRATLLPDLSILGQLIYSAAYVRLASDPEAPVSPVSPVEEKVEFVKVSNTRDIALPDGGLALAFDFQATFYLRGPGSESLASRARKDYRSGRSLRLRGSGTLVGSECLLSFDSMTAVA